MYGLYFMIFYSHLAPFFSLQNFPSADLPTYKYARTSCTYASEFHPVFTPTQKPRTSAPAYSCKPSPFLVVIPRRRRRIPVSSRPL